MTQPESASSVLSRLAVCSWSLRPVDPAGLVRQLSDIGLPLTQLDLDPLRENPAVWGDLPAVLADAGIRAVSGMFRTVGEDYTSLETIRRTGGLVPDGTWARNWDNLQLTASNARQLGLDIAFGSANSSMVSPMASIRSIEMSTATARPCLVMVTGWSADSSTKAESFCCADFML